MAVAAGVALAGYLILDSLLDFGKPDAAPVTPPAAPAATARVGAPPNPLPGALPPPVPMIPGAQPPYRPAMPGPPGPGHNSPFLPPRPPEPGYVPVMVHNCEGMFRNDAKAAAQCREREGVRLSTDCAAAEQRAVGLSGAGHEQALAVMRSICREASDLKEKPG